MISVIFRAIFFSLLVVASPAWARVSSSPAVTKDTLRLEGGIGGRSALELSNRIVARAGKPISLLINSPGGEVLTGSFIVNAIEVAKTRGSTITCVVPALAASMAFQILAHCDTRYALPNALLLWHPVRVMLMFAILTPRDAAAMAEDLRRTERRLVRDLEPRLGISHRVFMHHYLNETFHTAVEVNALVKKDSFLGANSVPWVTIVDDIPGIGKLFPLQDQFGGEEEEAAPGWTLIYQMDKK